VRYRSCLGMFQSTCRDIRRVNDLKKKQQKLTCLNKFTCSVTRSMIRSNSWLLWSAVTARYRNNPSRTGRGISFNCSMNNTDRPIRTCDRMPVTRVSRTDTILQTNMHLISYSLKAYSKKVAKNDYVVIMMMMMMMMLMMRRRRRRRRWGRRRMYVIGK